MHLKLFITTTRTTLSAGHKIAKSVHYLFSMQKSRDSRAGRAMVSQRHNVQYGELSNGESRLSPSFQPAGLRDRVRRQLAIISSLNNNEMEGLSQLICITKVYNMKKRPHSSGHETAAAGGIKERMLRKRLCRQRRK